MSAIQTALQGLINSGERLYKSADRIARGDVSAESMVDFKLAEHDSLAQMKALKSIADTEKHLLDIIA